MTDSNPDKKTETKQQPVSGNDAGDAKKSQPNWSQIARDHAARPPQYRR